MAVIAYQTRYGIRVLSEVPWRYWCGDIRDARGSMKSGDWPIIYCGNMQCHIPVIRRNDKDEVIE